MFTICWINKDWLDLLSGFVFQSLEQQQQKLSALMEICQQKDNIINKLQAAMDVTVENATRDVNTLLL